MIIGLTIPRHPVNVLFLLPLLGLVGPRLKCLGLVGFCLGAFLGVGPPPFALTGDARIRGEGRVVSLPRLTPFGQRCELELDGYRIALLYSGKLSLCPGMTVRVEGAASPPPLGAGDYYASHDLIGRVAVDDLSIERKGPWIQQVGCAWRNSFVALSQSSLPPAIAAEAQSLAFNSDGMLEPDRRDQMQRTGTTHIIAASGLQVVVIAEALLLALQLLPIARWLAISVVGCVLILYAVSTGLHPPVIRAGLMWLLATGAYLVRREADWLSALAFSSLFYLVWKPAGIYDMGFQFSFLAVFFLALFAVHVPWKRGLGPWTVRKAQVGIRTAVVGFVVATPLVAYHFGLISWVAIPANLLIVGAASAVVVISMASLGVGVFTAAGGALVLGLATPFVRYIDGSLALLGQEAAVVQIPPFTAYLLVPFYLGLLMMGRPYVRPT